MEEKRGEGTPPLAPGQYPRRGIDKIIHPSRIPSLPKKNRHHDGGPEQGRDKSGGKLGNNRGHRPRLGDFRVVGFDFFRHLYRPPGFSQHLEPSFR